MKNVLKGYSLRTHWRTRCFAGSIRKRWTNCCRSKRSSGWTSWKKSKWIKTMWSRNSKIVSKTRTANTTAAVSGSALWGKLLSATPAAISVVCAWAGKPAISLPLRWSVTGSSGIFGMTECWITGSSSRLYGGCASFPPDWTYPGQNWISTAPLTRLAITGAACRLWWKSPGKMRWNCYCWWTPAVRWFHIPACWMNCSSQWTSPITIKM